MGNNVWVGAKVAFLDGCIVGNNSVVAAGAVVNGIYPDNSIIGGIPGAGATMRTVVNIKSGGTTKLSGIIHSIILLLILLGLGKYVAYIPLSVLAGILITVGIGIIDRRGLKNIFKVTKSYAFIFE